MNVMDSSRLGNEIKKILIIRNDRLGDLVLSLPAIAALRRQYPTSKLAVLVQAYSQDILWHNPDIDQIIIDSGQDVFELGREIAKQRFDLAVILYPSWRNGWLCWLSRIPLRIGTGYKGVGILFNQRVYIHRTKVIHHEIDYCLKLAEKAGARPGGAGIRLWIKEENRQYARDLLLDYGLLDTFPLIGLHPGSGGSALNWASEHYARLIGLLSDRYGVRVVLSGGKEELGLIETIASQTSSCPVNLAGQTNLGQLMALFSLYHLFIGPSTGPMHIAAALGRAVVALYPPLASQSAAKWGPCGQSNEVLVPEGIICQEKRCLGQKCKLYNCMDRLMPEQVLEAAERQLYHASTIENTTD